MRKPVRRFFCMQRYVVKRDALDKGTPKCDFSNRLSHPGYAVHSRPDRMPCGTLRPTVYFLSKAGASA